jgi:hypothetical protein
MASCFCFISSNTRPLISRSFTARPSPDFIEVHSTSSVAAVCAPLHSLSKVRWLYLELAMHVASASMVHGDWRQTCKAIAGRISSRCRETCQRIHDPIEGTGTCRVLAASAKRGLFWHDLVVRPRTRTSRQLFKCIFDLGGLVGANSHPTGRASSREAEDPCVRGIGTPTRQCGALTALSGIRPTFPQNCPSSFPVNCFDAAGGTEQAIHACWI